MIIKSSKKQVVIGSNIGKSKTTVSNINVAFVSDQVKTNSDTVSKLQPTLNQYCYERFDTVTSEHAKDTPLVDEDLSKYASVKFMITMRDEAQLHMLGYSKAQIDTLKPQEAEDIIRAGKYVLK